jgi:hypothetical protein
MIAVGTRLGHYEILSSLGAVGISEVYHAGDTRFVLRSSSGKHNRIWPCLEQR